MKTPDDKIAIAHRVLAHEDFDETARILLKLLNDAQSKFPGANRYLYLEIDGHRNASGGFDQDTLELQTKFMEDFLIQFLIGADTPLAKFKNPKLQNNEIPKELNLIKIDPPPAGGPGESGVKPRF
jgi:hypothetical protein